MDTYICAVYKSIYCRYMCRCVVNGAADVAVASTTVESV